MTKTAKPTKKPKMESLDWIITIISLLFGFALALFTFWGLIISKAVFLLALVCTTGLMVLSFHFYLQSERKIKKYQKELKKGNLKRAKLKFKIQSFLSTLLCSFGVCCTFAIILLIAIMLRNHCSIFSSHTAYEIMKEKADGNVSFNSLKYLFTEEVASGSSNIPDDTTYSQDTAVPTEEAAGNTPTESTDTSYDSNLPASAADDSDSEVLATDSNNPEISSTDSNGSKAPVFSSSDESVDDAVSPAESESFILDPYDFSPLCIFKPYAFEDTITRQDLENIRTMYNTFMDSKDYNNMLNIPEDDYGNYSDIIQEIEAFDERAKSNSDIITSEELYQNVQNRLFCYGQNNNIKNLEQAAISAEGAVEKEVISVSGSYNNYIKYAKTGAIIFLCVSDSEQTEYESGTAADVRYRGAKLLYKPSANLLKIESEERYYSLCSAYVVSQDAFSSSTPECNYAVAIAYYHLKICSDLVDYIEPGEFRDEICREALGVHTEYKRRLENSNISLYQDFEKDAAEILIKIEMLLGYSTVDQAEEQTLSK